MEIIRRFNVGAIFFPANQKSRTFYTVNAVTEIQCSHGVFQNESKEFDAAKKENLEYQAARAEYDKIYGEKAVDTMSVREKLRQKEKIVKEREAGRVHQARQKDKGAR